VDKLQLNADVSPAQPAFSMSYLRLLMEVLNEHGYNQSRLLADAAIDLRSQPLTSGFVSFFQLNQLLSSPALDDNFYNLGLAVGQKLTISSHGIIGHLAMAGKTYLESFQLFARYIKLRTQLVDFNVLYEGAFVKTEFTTGVNNPQIQRFLCDSSVAGSYNLCKAFLGSEKAIHSVQFNYPEPKDLTPYHEIFSCPISFSHQCASVVLDLSYLTEVSDTANELMLRTAQQQCETLLKELKATESLTDKVLALLLATPEYCFNQQQLAECLGMSSRTLRRKLSAESSRYQDLVDYALKEQASSYLNNTQWSVEQIAELLGYSDTSNFNKAFKRWFGMGPKAYREASVRES